MATSAGGNFFPKQSAVKPQPAAPQHHAVLKEEQISAVFFCKLRASVLKPQSWRADNDQRVAFFSFQPFSVSLQRIAGCLEGKLPLQPRRPGDGALRETCLRSARLPVLSATER